MCPPALPPQGTSGEAWRLVGVLQLDAGGGAESYSNGHLVGRGQGCCWIPSTQRTLPLPHPKAVLVPGVRYPGSETSLHQVAGGFLLAGDSLQVSSLGDICLELAAEEEPEVE